MNMELDFIEELLFGNEPDNHKNKRKVYKWDAKKQKYKIKEN